MAEMRRQETERLKETRLAEDSEETIRELQVRLQYFASREQELNSSVTHLKTL